MSSKHNDDARYVVGIDLGTTNTVIAFADTWAAPRPAPLRNDSPHGESDFDDDDKPPPRPEINVFPVSQLTSLGQVEALALLPSFRYHPTADELPAADIELSATWGARHTHQTENVPAVQGALAQALGGKVPDRLVSSAKSWLCHGEVDRQAPILPWGAPDEVTKVSPVDASAGYLAHVRAAWDAAHPDHVLAEQQVVLTVPASFDDAARSLTLEAATRAGLSTLRLQEEPQAAFYDWLDRHTDHLKPALGGVRLILVLDAGGGTTDLSLIRAEIARSGPTVTRIAVGEHLLLGGDNMDHALARRCEAQLTDKGEKRLSAGRFSQLLQQCRTAKQTLLAKDGPEQVSITLLGGGSSLMAGRSTTVLTRAQVEETLLDGFLPCVDLHAQPATRRTGLVEFGLPFAADPVISRHVAAFLSRHRNESAQALGLNEDQVNATPASALPDGVLFNGGVFNSPLLEDRMRDVLSHLRGSPITQLDSANPNLAVARGAVAYGLSRRGIGLKIGGGSPRSYYLGIAASKGANQAVCILPRGTEEGQEVCIRQSFALRVGHPVRFALHASTNHTTHKPGALVSPDGSYEALPDLCAVIEQRPNDTEDLAVELHAQLTEVGTLEVSLVSTEHTSRRYRLEFQLRGQRRTGEAQSAARVSEIHPRFKEASELIQLFYGKAQKSLDGRKVNTLRNDLEKRLGQRADWNTPLLRELLTTLLTAAKRRRRSAVHERVWLGLAGYCLRPGYGFPVDDWRIEQLWPLYEQGVQFSPEAAVWSQFWILWRRLAGGLNTAQQVQIYGDLTYYLNPDQRKRGSRPKGPKKQGLEEMVRLAASLERLEPKTKTELGDWILTHIQNKAISPATAYWSLGRIGARAMFYGSAHNVVPQSVAERWIGLLMQLDLSKADQAAFSTCQLAQFTGDRARDIDGSLRLRVSQALGALPGGENWVQRVEQGGQLSDVDAGRVFGESLPPGLSLL